MQNNKYKFLKLIIAFIIILVVGIFLFNIGTKKMQERKTDDIKTDMLMIEGKIKSIKQKHQKEKPTVIPIIMYIGNQKWNIKQKNKIRYTKFEENNIELGYNIIDFNLYSTKELKNKKSKINKYIILKKEMNIYLNENRYNL